MPELLALMSYLVLARKYRPRVFADVVGQETVTGILRGAIEAERIGHAYLLSGPRGTGKTTTARIFAKALNCERGPSLDPCNECDRCLAADAGRDLDLIEIDAASNNSVHDVRELREQVGYAPSEARRKVYLIDEVHMLTKQAFNALLKTLEEPPAHVVFLFATTELHKVIETIRSRCQILRLEPIREETIAGRLDEVFRLEGVEAEAGVTAELARRARGGMRDALSLADQLLSLAGDAPRLEDCRRLAGSGAEEELDALIERILDHDRRGVLLALESFAGREGDLAASLLDHLRTALVALVCGPDTPVLEGDPARLALRAKLAERIGPARLEVWMQELVRGRERMRTLDGSERVVLELVLLDLCREELGLPLGELAARLASLEAGLGPAPAGTAAPAAVRSRAEAPRSADQKIAPRVTSAPAPSAPPADRSAPKPETKQPARKQAPPAQNPPAPAPPTQVTAKSPPPARQSQSAPRPPVTLDALATGLRARHASLADVLARCGRLAPADVGFLLGFSGLGPGDRRLLEDSRNRSAIERAFTALEEDGRLAIEIDPRPKAQSKPDPYTQEVADLFGGQIEEAP